MISRRDRIYQQYPEPVIGYELSPYKSEFAVIIPEATTNLALNPSLENGVTTGYTAVGGSLTASTAWQAYGSYCSRMVPAVSTESGQYYGTISLTAGITYTYSIVMQGDAGKLYYIWFGTTGGALLGAKKSFRATGKKQRVWVTYTETSSTTRRFYLTRDAQYTDQNVFYADGLQVEAKDHPTTYCDGSLKGFVVGENPYLWTGVPHASTSTRSAQTRSGGREMNLLDLGIRVLAVIGLGMMPLVDQSLPIPGYGELAQGTGTMAREFTLVSSIDAEAGGRHLSAQIATILDAFNPELVIKDQPMILRYQQLDDDGDPCGDSLDILCKYRTGLEGQNDNHHTDRVGLTFKQHIPYIQTTYDFGASLNYQLSVADSDFMLMRTSTGTWQAITSGASDQIYVWAKAADGSIYAGGQFLNMGGVAAADYIAKYDGTTWTALLNGTGARVTSIAVAPDGTLYAGGDFTNLTDANGDYISYWNGAAWVSLGTGMNGIVQDIKIAPDGTVYAAGNFTLAGGVANTVHIAKWDGANWTALSTGTNDTVYSIAIAPDGTVYIGGAFTLAGGVAGTAYIAKWDGAAFTPLGAGANDWVRDLKIGPDGILYACGRFTLMNGVTDTTYIARWNGTSWAPMGQGLATNGTIAMTLTAQNTLIVGGFNSSTLSINLTEWNGSIWTQMDVVLPGSPVVLDVFSDIATGNLYLGFNTSGSATTSNTSTVNNPSTSKSYPIVTFTGPGRVYTHKSFTTGQTIYFDLTLLAGETAVLNLDPQNPSFISSFRGDIWATAILPGSNLNFYLMPGDNIISTFIYGGTTAATTVTTKFQGFYNSLDAAVWK